MDRTAVFFNLTVSIKIMVIQFHLITAAMVVMFIRTASSLIVF